jgi:hypothetical protein
MLDKRTAISDSVVASITAFACYSVRNSLLIRMRMRTDQIV